MPMDPLQDESVRQAHDAACSRGDAGYRDPSTGLFVFTREYLRHRGWCCGNGCRHCPYGHVNVRPST